MKSDLLKSVQALRGLAALSVMLFHFRWNVNNVFPGMGDKLFGWGATGVDLFFLISGFVITLSAKKSLPGIKGASGFLKHRALRILPAYYIILLITFFLSGAMSTFHYPDKTANFISALTFQPIYQAPGPFYLDDSGMYGVRWTLNYEVWFYLVVGLLIALPFRKVTTWLFFFITLVLVPLIGFDTFTFSPEGYQTGIARLNFITNPMIFLFLAGMGTGLAYPLLKRVNGPIMTALFMGALGLLFFLFSQGLFAEHGLLGSGWIYLLIMITAIGAEKSIGQYIPGFLVRLGDISYSLYLIHTLMNTGIGKRFESVGIAEGLPRFFVSCVLSLILAWLSWRFIEKPFLSRRRVKSQQQTA